MSSIDYIEAYSEIHRNRKRFPGFSLKAYLEPIAALVTEHDTKTICDVGCGKARGYAERNYHHAWGDIMPVLYDPGVPKFSAKPKGQFGGVICSDVMEHIAEADISGMLDELISYVEPGGWLFLGVSCRPANKVFKTGALAGENMHLTVRAPSWWIAQIGAARHRKDRWEDIHIIAHWDVAGHFDEAETPWCSRT